MRPALKVMAPGGYTTVQDRGRFGFQNMGVPVSGVLDHFAFAMANFLTGNPENTAVLEITVTGPCFEVLKEMDLALTGAEMDLRVNDTLMPRWQSVRVRPGDTVTIGQVRSGCRAYLSVSGGIDVPMIMGSASTYAGAKIGGFMGRPLQAADILNTPDTPPMTRPRALPESMIPDYPEEVTLRAVPGPQDDFFDQGLMTLFESEYMVTAKADRMGYRLKGASIPIREGMPKSIVSEPSIPGSIQIPADEQPIILLVEQTVGGYAKIATVISTDLSKVAQTTPGDSIRFEPVDLETAHTLFRDAQKKLARIRDLILQA